MKLPLAAVVLVVTVMSAQSQIYVSAKPELSSTKSQSPIIVTAPERVTYTISRPPGLRMRNTGRTLTILGGAMLVSGIVLIGNADSDYYNSYTTSNGTYTEGDPKYAFGVLMVAGGVGMAVPGIIFWSKGAKKYNRHLEREAAFNFNGRGLSLSYRF